MTYYYWLHGMPRPSLIPLARVLVERFNAQIGLRALGRWVKSGRRRAPPCPAIDLRESRDSPRSDDRSGRVLRVYGSKGGRDEHRLHLAPTSQPQAELTTEGGQVATEGVAVDVAEVVAAAEQEGGRYADAPDEEPVSEGPGYDLVRLRLRVGVGVGVGVRARVIGLRLGLGLGKPHQQLKGFSKVRLKAGASQVVSLYLPTSPYISLYLQGAPRGGGE